MYEILCSPAFGVVCLVVMVVFAPITVKIFKGLVEVLKLSFEDFRDDWREFLGRPSKDVK